MVDGRNLALDGVRGFAALTVVIFHSMLSLDGAAMDVLFHTPFSSLQSARDLAVKLLMTLFHGDSAVVIFFILSGCVLITSLERDFRRSGFWRTGLVFVLRRVLRIYPAMFVSLVGMIAVLGLLASATSVMWFPYSLSNIVRNFLMIAPEVSAPTWTLIVEMLVVPFLLLFGYLVFFRLGLAGLWLFVGFAILVRSQTWILFDYSAMYHYLINFALGCLIPYAPGVAMARIGQRLGWGVLIVLFVAVRAFPIGFTVQPYIGVVFLSLVYHSPPQGLTRLLVNPVSQYLGRASYGVYLWHYAFTFVLVAVVASHAPLQAADPLLVGLLGAIPIAAAALVLGSLSERFIERPGIVLGRSLSGRLLAWSSLRREVSASG